MKKSKAIKPLLTVAIPAYNKEDFLEHAVMSVACSKYSKIIEVLIINDGSKDNTAKIGKDLEKQIPCVRIINKKNGGHGSAINAGLENAQGKYFRVLDSDDYFDTDSFNRFMQNLKQETSDLVLTTYIEYYANSGMTKYFNQYSHMMAGKQYDLDSLVFYSKGPMLPCTTIKTTALKKLNKKIDEHCFYVDQEYNLFSYLSCKTVTYCDVPVYRYRLEQEGQSMTQASLKKNSLHHETVTIRLLKEYSVIKNKLSETKKNIIENKIIIPMCQMQYHIIIVYNNNRKQFLSFDSKLKKFPVFYNNSLIAGKTVKLSRVTNGRFMKIFLFVRKIIKHEG